MRAHVLIAVLAVSITAATAECSTGSGNLLIVDSLGGADFLQITAAIAAAVDGDTILVRPWRADDPGHYDAFTILDKDLRVVTEEYGLVRIGGAAVEGLTADKQVVLSGMIAVVEGLPGDPVSPLLIRDCAGAVQVTRCYWHEGNSKAFAGLGCVQIENSENVVLDRCIANGQGASALAGMAIYDSRVALYDCWVKGSDEAEWRPNEGMPGLYASASYVWIERGYCKGGWGPWTCPYGVYGRGGPGALIENLSTVFVTDTGFEGGHGGIGGDSYFACAEYGPTGYEHVVDNSKLEFLPDETRGLHLEPVLTWGREVEIRAFGSPGETLYLRRSTDTIFETPSDGRGVVHVPGSPATEIELGIVAEDGELTTSFPLRGLLPDGSVSTFRIHSEFNTLYLQVVGRDEANRARYGAVVPLTYYPMGLLDTQPRILRVDVDADIGGDGRSWETAYQDLHDASSEADAITRLYPMRPVEIWVSEGRYTPAPPGGDQSARFQLYGARVFGGFAGNEITRDERNWITHPTILSGDLDGNDGPVFTNRADNSKYVVRVSTAYVNLLEHWPVELPPVTLDGFVVEGAEEGLAVSIGGGVLRNCVVRDNSSSHKYWAGTASAGNSQVVNCTFSKNRGRNGAALVIGNSRFLDTQNPQLTKPTRVEGCVFDLNDGYHGAVVATPDPELGRVVISNCLFQANSGILTGALLCELATSDEDQILVEVLNSTFHINHGTAAGGILTSKYSKGVLVVANTIVWNNSAGSSTSESAQIGSIGGTTIALEYSCVMGYDKLGGIGNHGLDPRFVDAFGPDLLPGTGDEDLGLGPDSPCADAADNGRLSPDRLDADGDGDLNEILPTDLSGARRRADDEVVDTGVGDPPIVDMGALERQKGS